MSSARGPLRILVVAPERHALRQPHAGGLEAVVWDRVRWLRARGHSVSLSAAAGSDFLGAHPDLVLPSPRWSSPRDSSDSEYPPGHRTAIADTFDRLLDHLGTPAGTVDVVDNHSLHGEPILWSRDAGIPVVTTLHTPPLPGMVAAATLARFAPHRSVAVSQHTAQAWSVHGVDAFVFPNGVDTTRWRLGTGGDDWVWFGRIVPEKAPHLAVQAARRAGARIVLAGRVGDAEYFRRAIVPLLDDDVRYVGPLKQSALSRLVGRSAVALVTPVWSEPFGLVIAEALATGTPVAAFEVGGVAEVLHGIPGAAAVPAADIDALAGAAAILAEGSRTVAARIRTRRATVALHSLHRRHGDVERVLAYTADGGLRPAAQAVVG